ncbi:MAG: LysR substrate-binding domain-containing protein [Planctomycetota bacterium]
MEIHQLRYFLAVAERGGMREAARSAHVTQPSLSKQIKKLENELGQRLFERSSLGAVLTPAGEALLPRARAILADVDTVADSVRCEVGQRPLSLAAGAIPTMAPLLPKLVRGTRGRFRQLPIRLHENLTQHLVADVAGGTLDFAILSTPVRHDRLEIEVIGNEPLLVALPAGHRLAKRKHVTLHQLKNEPAVVLDDVHCLGQQISDYCTNRDIGSHVICRSTQISTVIGLVRLGFGHALVPDMCAEGDGVRFVEIARDKPRREIALAWPKTRPRSAEATFAADVLRRLFQ